MTEKSKQRLLMGNGTLEDFKAGQRMFEMLAGMFFRPIIGHTVWKDSITEEQKQRIQIERLKQIAESNGEPITTATDYEAMIYIMTASLSAPLDRTYVHIYSFLFRKFYPDKAKEIFPDHEGQKLDQWTEEPELTRLKQWLWKKSKP